MDQRGSTDIFLFEGFRFDRGDRELFRLDAAGNGSAVSIGSRALDLLGLLVEREGRLVSKTEIIDVVWRGSAVEEANLTVQISALRRVLDRGREQNSCIQTVPGRGYRFVAGVTRVEPAVPPVSPAPRGNGGAPVAEDGLAERQGAPVQIESPPHATTPKERHPLWRGITAAVTGALILVAVVVAALNWHLLWPGDARPVPRLSIVVMPFANLGQEPEQQYFADGVTEDLTIDLSRIAHMFVISRNTAFTYRNWGRHYLYLRPQVVHAAALKPVHEIVAYVAGRIGDTNEAKCWPDARRAIRQAALDGSIRIYGCKSEDTGNSQATSWSLVRTLIPPEYWELADITEIATVEHWKEQLTPHSFPHRLSDGRFTNEKITYYTKLQAKWDEVKKAWP